MRTVLCLAGGMLVSTAHAASIKIGEPQPADTLRIEAEYVDVTRPSSWQLKSPTGPNPPQSEGWQRFGIVGITVVNTNPNLLPPV